jgi:hypothetical protein
MEGSNVRNTCLHSVANVLKEEVILPVGRTKEI